MAMVGLVEYADASPAVKAVYDDIMATRKVDWINNIWKALATHPPTLARIWAQVKAVMGPGTRLDPLTKELIYLAVSMTNNCEYCIHSHGAAARKQGMGVVGMKVLAAGHSKLVPPAASMACHSGAPCSTFA